MIRCVEGMTHAVCHFDLRRIVRTGICQQKWRVYSPLDESLIAVSVVLFAMCKVGVAAYSVVPVSTLKNYHPFPFFLYCTQSYSVLFSVSTSFVCFSYFYFFYCAYKRCHNREATKSFRWVPSMAGATMPGSFEESVAPVATVDRELRYVKETSDVSAFLEIGLSWRRRPRL